MTSKFKVGDKLRVLVHKNVACFKGAVPKIVTVSKLEGDKVYIKENKSSYFLEKSKVPEVDYANWRQQYEN